MELCAFKRNNFILYKLIPCLLIIMFAVMCLYGSKVYASNTFVSVEGNTFVLPDFPTDFEYNYYIAFKKTSNNVEYYYLALLNDYEDNTNYVQISSDGSLRFLSSNNNKMYRCKTTDSSFSFYEVLSSKYGSYCGYSFDELISTQVNIYSAVDYSLVFQAPSQTQTIVASQVGEVEMNKTLQEILGILPVVIVVLVGLIAIRKGILFLMARMKKA